jgi:DNA-binding MarR family transcriptional regulator
MERDGAATDVLADELARRVGSLQRVLRQRTRAALGEPGLSTAEVELLALGAARPGLRVGDAATALRLAPNTVSTLARRLAAQGLLLAERDESDRRCVRLRPSAEAERRLRRWRDERAHLLAGAIERVSEPERNGLASSLPILAALGELLADAGEPRAGGSP